MYVVNLYILWTYMKIGVTVSCDTLGSHNAKDPDMVNRVLLTDI